VAAGAAAAGAGRFATPEENPGAPRNPNPTDPQRGNCPQDRGGAQGKGNIGDGSDVANVIFSTTSLPGFNGPHVPPPAGGKVNPITRTNFFKVAQSVNDAKHLHAVKTVTNADGEAGVLFIPSRCGGDRYRIRAYLGPPKFSGAGSNGQGAGAVSVDTGTFVLWRHMRISRYVRQPSSNVDPTLLADAKANAVGLNIGNIVLPAVATANDYLQRVFAADATGTVKTPSAADLSFTVPSAATGFDPLPVQWARAFVEVEIDRAAQSTVPETMSNDDWERARAQAFRDGQGQMASLGLNLDLERLFYFGTAKPASLTVDNAVVQLPMRSIQSYNGPTAAPAVAANRRIGAPGNTVANIQKLIANYMIPGFIRSLSSNGYTPGITIVQAVYGCTWTMFSNNANGNYSNSSGESYDYRAGALWAGVAAYPTTPIVPAPSPNALPWANYGFTSNVCHELGHVNFCLHSNPPEAHNAIRHDPGASNLSVCLMSYQNCEGQFCAKCLFSLRGWDLSKLTY
jgi:hypothetical protein